MTFARSSRGPLVLAFSLLAVLALLLSGPAHPALAAPGDDTTVDSEGGTQELREALDAAAKGYDQAKTKLAASKKRQAEIVKQLKTSEATVNALTNEASQIAAEAYRNGGVSTISVMLDSESLSTFVERTAALGQLSKVNHQKLTELQTARQKLEDQKRKLEAEIKEQALQEKKMAQKKADAEEALDNAEETDGPTTDSRATNSTTTAGNATPARRNSDGSWPSEGCSINDPTGTGGCITPRTLNALNQAKSAGFNRFVYCWSNGSWGEHPQGRACDFAADEGGFGGVAQGASKAYGDRLANYFIANADRLGVMYVIWWYQIWMPSTGWRSYSGGGDPSSDHSNHVHLSMY